MGDSITKRLVEQNGKQNNGRITSGSGLLCLVIPTNEELMIAKKLLVSRAVPNNPVLTN
jgi:acetate kinase